MIQVVDASAVVAALVDDSPTGRWCEQALQEGALAAPHLMPFEAANIVRRLVLRDELDETAGAIAIDDLGRLAIDLAPYQTVAARVWELRRNLTAYDAAYVATAELLGGRLVTLDERLTRAPGFDCDVVTPP